MATSVRVLKGKDPRLSSFLSGLDMSMEEMMAIPAREVRTPKSFRRVKCSTWVMAPRNRDQMPDRSQFLSFSAIQKPIFMAKGWSGDTHCWWM